MTDINIYLTHFSWGARKGKGITPWNLLTMDYVKSILADHLSRYVDVEIYITDNKSPKSAYNQMQSLLAHCFEGDYINSCFPLDVRQFADKVHLQRNDLKANTHTSCQTYQLNHFKESDVPYALIFTNDHLAPPGMIRNLFEEMKWAEAIWPDRGIFHSPRMHPIVREKFLADGLKDPEWRTCAEPYNGMIQYSGTGITDCGHLLGVHLQNRKALDVMPDRRYWHPGWFDLDWGVRAIHRGCKNLWSNTCHALHFTSSSVGVGKHHGKEYYDKEFMEFAKMGSADILYNVFTEETAKKIIDGRIWREIHDMQGYGREVGEVKI